MSLSPRFSVLLPTHNRAGVLGFAIRAVLAQTESDFELLIVGDGCTDNTADVVAGFQDPRIRWLDLPKAPYYGYANRNVALRQAKGEYVAFMAHDDLVTPDHLALLANELERSQADWVYSRPLWVSRDGTVVPFATNLKNPLELADYVKRNTIPASCVLHRRSCFERVGYWPEDVERAADWVFWKRIIQSGSGRNLSYCSTPTVLHFVASWKSDRASGSKEVAQLLKIADRASWWPSTLRVDIPARKTEQEVFADAMTTGGKAWVEQLRSDVELVLDFLAWENVRSVRPALARREEEIRGLKEALTVTAETSQELRLELARTQSELTSLQETATDALKRAQEAFAPLPNEVDVLARRLHRQHSRMSNGTDERWETLGQESRSYWRHMVRTALKFRSEMLL